MKTLHFPVTAHVGIIFTATILLSCTTQTVFDAPSHQPVTTPAFEQIGHGAETNWQSCVPPECTAHTPKTLALPQAPISPNDTPATLRESNTPRTDPHPVAIQPTPSLEAAPQAWIVPFAVNSTELSDTARMVVGLASIEIITAGRITIIGYPDGSEDKEPGIKLAFTRAAAVADELARIRPNLTTSIKKQARISSVSTPLTGASSHVFEKRVLIVFEPALPP
ncbi:MAG: hypothetical protein FWD67_04130 [Betaproteobacteria bacterium]|nr:hypothetical protein [Betaproteobacteria bacterium]